ncbi:MAG: DUF1080 domain-containing protein [Pedobacter sp.]|nr:DUF1080 domain-containing protein [Pedobacter sp.]
MRIFKLRAFAMAFPLMLLANFGFAQTQTISLDNLSAFKNPKKNWAIVGGLMTDLSQNDAIKSTKGTGILFCSSSQKNHGSDLFTNEQFGNIVVELDYLMAKGGNSGIYLQGNYEIQLEDSWGYKNPTSANNGGVYGRWDASRPEGEEVVGGFAPRQNVSKAPGLWQHLKIVFQAPTFDGSGSKTANAKILQVALNGVVIHENIELVGPTRGNVGKEVAMAPLRLQGDHGSVAFRNISVKPFQDMAMQEQRGGADPIYIEANSNVNLRSFVPLENNVLAPHGISVGGPEQVSFSYDLDKGMLMKAWHGQFLETTAMWDGRGNGTSKPEGNVTYFTKQLIPSVAMLKGSNDTWPKDTVGSGYKPKGYVMDAEDRPEFKYITYGTKINDAIKAMPDGHGLNREISTDKSSKDLYLLLANATDIQEVEKGLYVLNDKSYYIKINEANGKPIIRDNNGMKQLIMPIGSKLNYSILF